MIRAFQKSSAIGKGTKILASTSISSKHERNIATKKAVIFNLKGSLIPAIEPVVKKYARDNKMSPTELTAKLFKDGDRALLAKVEPALISRHGLHEVAFAEMLSAIQGVRAEGIKTALIADAGDLDIEHLPIDNSLFDTTSTTLKPDIFDQLKIDSSDAVYLDNIEKNLKTAKALGMTAINVGNIEEALRNLEASVNVPLKEFVPGFSWVYWDKKNNPYTNTKENLLYYLLVIYICMVTGHLSLKHVFKVDGTFDVLRPFDYLH